MFDSAYKVYEFRTSESKIIRHLNSFAFTPGRASGYHGNLVLHPEICCESKEKAMEVLDEMAEYPLEDNGILFLDRGRKNWLVKATWRL